MRILRHHGLEYGPFYQKQMNKSICESLKKGRASKLGSINRLTRTPEGPDGVQWRSKRDTALASKQKRKERLFAAPAYELNC
jgi:hypothetical protein